jgi:hypothetical protein
MNTQIETAINRCLQAWRQALAVKKVKDPFDLGRWDCHYAGRAYCNAIPYLMPDQDSIDIFVACITHGMLLGAIQPQEASKLLYAAQIALGSARNRQQATKPGAPSLATASSSATAGRREPHPAPSTPTPTPSPSAQQATTPPTPPPSGASSSPAPEPRAPSLATASSSARVGDHKPHPAAPQAPTPSPLEGGEAAIGRTAGAPPSSPIDKDLQAWAEAVLTPTPSPVHYDPTRTGAVTPHPPTPVRDTNHPLPKAS